VVEPGRTQVVSASRGIVDLRGCGWEQRISPASLEGSTLATGKSTGDLSFISLNWKGKPLVNYETVVNLIGGTTTKHFMARWKGLAVQ
jgi:hypothetical protein